MHAADREGADRYRVEPYVLAGDVYGEPPHTGRGGWTWYTGAAGWYLQCVLALLGYERRGDEARLCALLGGWPQVAVTVRFGNSEYRLICRRGARGITLDGAPVLGDTIHMQDDGKRMKPSSRPGRRPSAAKKTQMITFRRYFALTNGKKRAIIVINFSGGAEMTAQFFAREAYFYFSFIGSVDKACCCA